MPVLTLVPYSLMYCVIVYIVSCLDMKRKRSEGVRLQVGLSEKKRKSTRCVPLISHNNELAIHTEPGFHPSEHCSEADNRGPEWLTTTAGQFETSRTETTPTRGRGRETEET